MLVFRKVIDLNDLIVFDLPQQTRHVVQVFSVVDVTPVSVTVNNEVIIHAHHNGSSLECTFRQLFEVFDHLGDTSLCSTERMISWNVPFDVFGQNVSYSFSIIAGVSLEEGIDQCEVGVSHDREYLTCMRKLATSSE